MNEDIKQVIYALERQIRALEEQRDKLGARMDYDAQFFESDANRLREAVALIKHADERINFNLDRSWVVT